jgi:hypothetical protein
MSAGAVDPGNVPALLMLGDCVERMADLPADHFDAVVTDPPYELGFMGKGWDRSGVAFNPATWAAALAIAKPGAHLLAFGGSRTFHRLAVAIEDAGWELRDTVLWLYGSGFPKSRNIGKALDKLAGAEREELGRAHVGKGNHRGAGFNHAGGREGVPVTGPATDAAKQWDGWGTALKPGWEPVIVARKPFRGSVEKNVLEHGTGALNIDGCRVAGPAGDGFWAGDEGHGKRAELGSTNWTPEGGRKVDGGDGTALRWPANVAMDEEAAAMLDAQAPDVGARAPASGPSATTLDIFGAYAQRSEVFHGDSGGASRFFYCAKASRAERDAGLEHLRDSTLARSGGAQGAEARGEEYDAAQGIGLNAVSKVKNHHPTVKPVDLMRWLCRLVTPPGGVILDPFCGSGSTGLAARAEGFRFVGIEKDPSYYAIARARVVEMGSLFAEPAE